jgi:biopolymer transport protein ExbD
MRTLVLIAALVACKQEAAPPPPSAIDKLALPEVGEGFEPALLDEKPLVVAPGEIRYGTTSVVTLDAGVARAADREGGEMGMKISRVSTALAPAQPRPLQLAFDKTVPYHTLVQVMYSAKQVEAGYKQFQLLAKSGGKLVQATFTLPDKKPMDDRSIENAVTALVQQADEDDLAKPVDNARGKARVREKPRTAPPKEPVVETTPAPPPPIDPKQPVRLAVSLSKAETILWSMTGLEGTLPDPKLRVPAASASEPVRAALSEIVQRRWHDPKDRETAIVLMAEREIPLQRIADVIAAMRRTGFSDVQFSSGFE